MKDNIHHIFQVPDDSMENARKKVFKKMEVIRELQEYPVLKKVKESISTCFHVPNDYFFIANQEVNKKIKDADLKIKGSSLPVASPKKTRIIHLYVKRIAAVLILTLTAWFTYKFLLKGKDCTPEEISVKSYADTCMTLACIERETILNELYYEASEDELENLN